MSLMQCLAAKAAPVRVLYICIALNAAQAEVSYSEYWAAAGSADVAEGANAPARVSASYTTAPFSLTAWRSGSERSKGQRPLLETTSHLVYKARVMRIGSAQSLG